MKMQVQSETTALRIDQLYSCPICGLADLVSQGSGFRCCECGESYDLCEETVDFSKGNGGTTSCPDNYERDLAKVLDLASDRGWLQALQSTFSQSFVTYATDMRKTDALHLLDVERADRALDLGCGLGTFTLALARCFTTACAVDAIARQAQFVQLRAQQSGFRNVLTAVMPPNGRLPYRANVFDLVVMSNVFEWVATAHSMIGTPVGECQRNILREVHRVLRPGGVLYLSTKNRLALRYLVGCRDEHTGVRFASLLPERLLGAVTRFKTGRELRVRLHSTRSMTKMLSGLGFEGIEFWTPLPDSRHPWVFFRSRDRIAARELRRRGFGLCQLPRLESFAFSLLPSRMIPALSYCFAVAARKEALD